MKRYFLISAIVAFALVLAACGSIGGSASAASSGRLRNAPRTLSPEAKLAVATLNLENTPQAVDAAEAAKLLPLWQLVVQLNSSNSSAPQEVQAVVDQIRQTMTAEQIQAIDRMQITPADAFTGFQGQGQSGRAFGSGGFGNGGGSGNSSSGSPRNQGGGQFFFGGGGPGGGGFGGGGFGGGGFGGSGNRGATGTATQSAASSAQSAQQAANAVSGFLANRVIRLLESKVQS